MIKYVLFIISITSSVFGDIPCAARNEDYESVVCVCNATYCDEISKISKQPPGTYISYTSSKNGLRFQKSKGRLSIYTTDPPKFTNSHWLNEIGKFLKISPNPEEIILEIDRSKKFQTIVGFGGGFTDASSIHYHLMNKKMKKKFIRSYFSENGIEYNMGRVPIAGSDFSTHPYTYNMKPEYDVHLSNFSLSEEDFLYKAPFIKAAQKAATDEIYFIATAWSPPIWMKTSHNIGKTSFLFPEYYQTWADYHLKFLEEYKKLNISYWAVSAGNEPTYGVIVLILEFPSLGWDPREQAKWIGEHLGPTIKNNEQFKDVKIIGMDDQRFFFPLFLMALAQEPKSIQYVDGFSTHWYLNQIAPPELADLSHLLYKDKIIMSTEASPLQLLPFSEPKILIGSWKRGEDYIEEMIKDFNHWYVAWLDWNLVVDRQGGPNWFNNFVDGSILIFHEKKEFIKQPMFYAMGHFSKFIPRGSIRINLEKISGGNCPNVAFLRPDGGIAVIIQNREEISHYVTIKEKNHGQITLHIPNRSVISLVYW